MGDDELRSLERAWRESGSLDAGVAWLGARRRVGELTPRVLELLAYLGFAPARELLGLAPADLRLPRAAYEPGVAFELEEPACRVELLEGPARLLVRWPEARLEHEALAVCSREVVAWGARIVGLDLSRVPGPPATVQVGQLTQLASWLEERGGALALLGASESLRDLIEVLGLSGLLRFLQREDELLGLKVEPPRPRPMPCLRVRPGANLRAIFDRPTPAERADLDWCLGLARWGRTICLRAAWEAARLELAPEETERAEAREAALAAVSAYLAGATPQATAALREVAERTSGWAQIAAEGPLQRACWARVPKPYRLPCPRSALSERLIEWALR